MGVSRQGGAIVRFLGPSDFFFGLGFGAEKVLYFPFDPNLAKEILVAVPIEDDLAGRGWCEIRFVPGHGQSRTRCALDVEDMFLWVAEDVRTGSKVG